MGKLFGTDGVRGIANEDLTAELAYKLGQAGAYVLTGEIKHIPKILVGMDTRISGHMLKSALVAGICSVGAEAVSLGVVPTPAIAYLTRRYNADAGVIISASHNPELAWKVMGDAMYRILERERSNNRDCYMKSLCK
jgi:phosphoglucosamine mutase